CTGPNPPWPPFFKGGDPIPAVQFLRLDLMPPAWFPRAHAIRFLHDLTGPMIHHRTAMFTAFGAAHVVIDVPNGREVARSAVGAALHAAVGRQRPFEGARQFLLQELLGHAAAQVVPGQDFVEEPAAEIELGGYPGILQSALPEIEAAHIGPSVEAAAE